jgi:hypothetical protein
MPVPSQGHYVFTVFRLLTDFVCLYTYEFWLSLYKIVRSSVILLLPLFSKRDLCTCFISFRTRDGHVTTTLDIYIVLCLN